MGVAADSASASREQFMRAALTMAERGMAAGGPPVGACLVRESNIVAVAHNAVIGELDVTAHAEVCVLREACRKLRRLDLSGSSLYVTLEPCTMCLTAAFYAGVSEVIYGAPIAAMDSATGRELCVPADTLFAAADGAPAMVGGILAAECTALVDTWKRGRA